MNTKVMLVACVVALFVPLLSGCEDVVLFESKEDAYQLKDYSKDTLEEDVFYVKNGTKFHAIYQPADKNRNHEMTFENIKTAWFMDDSTLIPEYYKNESLAYTSSKLTGLENIKVERYKDLGYSIGVAGGALNEEGAFCFDSQKDCIPKSSAYKQFQEANSNQMKLISLDGVPIADYEIVNGVIVGLEQNKTYQVEIYTGTYFGTAEIVADTRFMQSFETYHLKESEATKNGYVRIRFQEDFKSGYYNINSKGFVRYYDFPKEEKKDQVDMNEAFYNSEMEQLKATSQEFLISVDETLQHAIVEIEYQATELTTESVTAKLTSPSGETYTFKEEGDHKLASTLQEIQAGKWVVNITPTEVEVRNIEVKPLEEKRDKLKEKYTFNFEEDVRNIVFRVEYDDPNADVVAVLTDVDGKTYSLEKIEKNSPVLTYDCPYLKKGEYHLFVYYYIGTELLDVGYQENADRMDTDTIIVVE